MRFLMNLASRVPIPSRYFGMAGSIAVHCAVGLALFVVARTPGTATRSERPGQRTLLVELLPLSNEQAAGTPVPMAGHEAPLSATQNQKMARPAGTIISTGRQLAAVAAHSQMPAGATAGHLTHSERSSAAAFSGADSPQFRMLLLRHIERFLHYPEDARRESVEGISQVQFVMDDQGRVGEIWVELSSGSAALDDEAIAAVMRAQPLPRPPASWPDSFAIAVPIGYRLK